MRTAIRSSCPCACSRARNSDTSRVLPVPASATMLTSCVRPASMPRIACASSPSSRSLPTNGAAEPVPLQPTRGTRPAKGSVDAVGGQRLRLPLHRQGADGVEAKRMLREQIRRAADEDLPRPRCVVQARGRVDCVAAHCVGIGVVRPDAACDHRPGVDADMQLKRPRRSAPSRLRSAQRLAPASRSRAHRRSGSSSCATGAPNTAITASPTYFSTNPSKRSMVADIWLYRSVCSERTSSGSSRSQSAVKPDRSANRTVTGRRSACASVASGGAPSRRPQFGQKANAEEASNPQAAQAIKDPSQPATISAMVAPGTQGRPGSRRARLMLLAKACGTTPMPLVLRLLIASMSA